MPIQTDKNTNYGAPLVTAKYSPLANIQYVPGDANYYSALLINRWNLLNAANILPRNLRLATANWAAIIAAEAGHLPPLVVISSNRSAWIAGGITAANNQLMSLGIATFPNASDLRALTAQVGQRQSPPIYCPTRTGGLRNVYIVVHVSEYTTYQAALAGRGVTVVGWVFETRTLPPAGYPLAGFGPSRFAAIEFCKTLRTAAGNPWDYAWLFDDNVVAFTGDFAGYAAVEAAMAAAAAARARPPRTPPVCAGFRGGSSAEPFATNRAWAGAELLAGRGRAAANLPASAPPGIIQQAVLWNIAYLTANHLNFGPVYISSGEDVSFGNYFNAQNIPYFYYGGIGVRKEVARGDDSPGAQRVTAARQGYAAWFAAAEAAGAAAALPPPVEVQPTGAGDGGVQTLANFIVNRVLPNSGMRDNAGDLALQNTAKCQAVEQITCGAINSGANFVTPAALATTFQINGAVAQAVTRINLP